MNLLVFSYPGESYGAGDTLFFLLIERMSLLALLSLTLMSESRGCVTLFVFFNFGLFIDVGLPMNVLLFYVNLDSR